MILIFGGNFCTLENDLLIHHLNFIWSTTALLPLEFLQCWRWWCLKRWWIFLILLQILRGPASSSGGHWCHYLNFLILFLFLRPSKTAPYLLMPAWLVRLLLLLLVLVHLKLIILGKLELLFATGLPYHVIIFVALIVQVTLLLQQWGDVYLRPLILRLVSIIIFRSRGSLLFFIFFLLLHLSL